MHRSFNPPLPFRRLILTSNFMSSVSQFPHLPIYNSISLPVPNHLSIPSNKHIHLQFELSLNKSFRAPSLLPIHLSSPPWTFNQPSIRFDSTKISPSSNTSYIRHIRCILDENPNHTLCFSDGSKSKQKSVYAYSINGSLVSHHIRNKASVFTAELMAIFSCLSHLTLLPPHGRFLLLTDSFSSLHSLSNRLSTNPRIQRIRLTLHSLHSIDSRITFIWIPGHIGFPEHDAVDKAAKQATFLPKITDYTRLHIADLKNHYRSLSSNNGI